jgi:type II secretory pathway component GspD/PulD (secretin)
LLLLIPSFLSAQQADTAADPPAAQPDAPATIDQATDVNVADQPVPELRFAFREQKWIDVLDWFARQADLSLVVNEVPPGNFTYSDTKLYTPTEALDLLNGVLNTRGFALVRRDRMLICANLNEGIPDGLIPRVQLDALDQYGQFELVEVMFPLGKRPAEAVAEEIRPLLGKYGKATVLPQTSQLLVTTTAGQMRAVNAIISSIPEPQPPKPEPKKPDPPKPELVIYPAENVDPNAATEMIKSLVGDVKMTVDSQSGQINAYATPQQHEVIQKLLQQMASSTADERKPTLEIYSVEESQSTAILQQLRLIIPGATLTLDADPSRLIAYATPEQHKQLRETLDKLGAEASDPARDIPVVYSLRHADPQAVVTMVEKLFPRAKVSVEPESGRLVLLATTAQQNAIRQFIEQLEARPTNQPEIQYYALDALDAGQAQSVLASLITGLKVTHDRDGGRLMVIAPQADQQRVSEILDELRTAQTPSTERTLNRYEMTAGLRSQFERNFRDLEPKLRDVKLLDSGSPSQLLVLATQTEHAMIQTVVDQLREQFPEQDRRLKYYPLDKSVRDKFRSLHGQLAPDLGTIQMVDEGSAEGLGILATDDQHRQIELVIEQLQQELPAQNQRLRVFAVTPTQRERFLALRPSLDQQLGSVRIIDPARPGELVAWGSDSQLSLIESMLTSLRSVANEQPLQLVSYPLSEGDPASIESLLSELYPDMKIVVDAESRRVMVWTTVEQHTIIAQAIEQLDAPAASGKSRMAYYRLGEIDARDVAQLFEQQFPKMSLVTDRDSNSIIAWGSDKEHEELAKTVEEFRKQAASTARKVISYPIGGRNPYRMRRLFGDLAPNARVVEDEENRAVLVWATQEEHQAIEQAMQQVSSSDDQTNSSTLKTYIVTRVRPQDVLRLLDEIAPSAEGTDLDDERRLLVYASEKDHERIAAAIERIEAADPELDNQTTVQVYPLGETSPEVVMPLLDAELLRGASVSTDDERNALVIRAGVERHVQLKSAIDAIIQNLPGVRRRESRVYRLEHANPSSLQDALAGLIPGVTVAVDTDTRSLIAAAYPEEHERIAATVQDLDRPQTARNETRAYRLGSRDFYGLRSAIQQLAPNAVVASDRSSRMLLVTAEKADQDRIAQAIQQLESGGKDDRSTRVYRMLAGDPEAAEDALEALLPSALIQGDNEAGTLVVTASEEDQAQAKAVIEQLEATPQSTLQSRAFRMQHGDVAAARDAIRSLLPKATVEADRRNRSLLVTARESDLTRVAELITEMDQSNTTGQETRAYAMQYGDAVATQTALRALLPEAVIASDPANRTVLATATPEEHERIKAAVEQMDRPNDQLPVLQAYTVTNADLQSVFNSINTMYQGNAQVTLTPDQTNQSILVKAPPREQQTIAQIVSRMENGAALGEERTLVVYPVKTQDDATLLTTLQNLFKNQQPPVDLSLNSETQQLIAVASPRQHATLRQAVNQIQSEPFLVEVFPLQTVDPFAIELAIDRLYEDATSRPVANGDTETQQLFVRGTQEQIDDVRQLLVKMGELPAQQGTQQRGMRMVPFRGDAQDAVDQLREIWPQLSTNPLRVVRPQSASPILQQVTPQIEMFDAAPPNDPVPGPVGPPVNDAAPSKAAPGKTPDQTAPDETAPDEASRGAVPTTNETATTMLVQTIDPGRAPEAAAIDDDANQLPAVQNPRTQASTDPSLARQNGDERLPVIIVPEQNSITILSEDEAALAQAEALLRTLARQSSSDASAGNFAMYSLRNAGASNLVKMLTELFEQMPITTRAIVGRVSMVADERLNAVIVHGRPADRAVIGELLRVLDSSNVPDSLANARPRIVPVEYLEAERLLELLQGVYETQLKTGGDSRSEMDIPEGISREVASLLRQINAAASGPLLTLEVDSVTNSIVVLAPNQLSAEVESLIRQLDENARNNDSRDIGIVTLKGTNVQQIEDALEQLLRTNRRGR